MERNWEGTAIEGIKSPIDEDATRGFGLLKAVLSSVSVEHKVRFQFAARNYSSTNQFTGNNSHRKKDRRPPFTHRGFGKAL